MQIEKGKQSNDGKFCFTPRDTMETKSRLFKSVMCWSWLKESKERTGDLKKKSGRNLNFKDETFERRKKLTKLLSNTFFAGIFQQLQLGIFCEKIPGTSNWHHIRWITWLWECDSFTKVGDQQRTRLLCHWRVTVECGGFKKKKGRCQTQCSESSFCGYLASTSLLPLQTSAHSGRSGRTWGGNACLRPVEESKRVSATS